DIYLMDSNGFTFNARVLRIAAPNTAACNVSVLSSGGYLVNGMGIWINQTVAAPLFTVTSSTANAVTVTAATTTGGATIRYTTDGTDPTVTTGTLYTGAITMTATTMLKVRAFKPDFIDSAVT